MKDLAVLIVSYNSVEYLAPCLASVYASQGATLEVCVVDNASEDGSPQLVRDSYPQASLLQSPVNGGYAYANNLGLRHLGVLPQARSDGQNREKPYRFVLLLNPDTLVEPGDFAKAIAYMDAHPQVGVLGPKLVRQDGSLDLACRRSFPTPEVSFYRMTGLSNLFPRSRRFGRYNLTYLDPDQTTEVDAVAGAFMLVRQEAIQQAGALDESFFMYGEDLDWCLRMKARGWSVVYFPEVVVLHHKGVSRPRHRHRTTIEFYRSMLIFYRKHYAHSTFFLLDWLIVAAILLRGALAYAQNLLLPAAFGWVRSPGPLRTRS